MSLRNVCFVFWWYATKSTFVKGAARINKRESQDKYELLDIEFYITSQFGNNNQLGNY